jgi:hypothetical protein
MIMFSRDDGELKPVEHQVIIPYADRNFGSSVIATVTCLQKLKVLQEK